MYFKIIPVGRLQTNAYLLGCERTKKCLVIDPGDEGERILQIVNADGYKLEKIINTHGHYDHVNGNSIIKGKTGAKIYIHEAEKEFLEGESLSLRSWVYGAKDPFIVNVLLKEGDVITLGDINLEVIHTPGHSPGCITLKGHDSLFTGDTLFAGAIGRTDLPGGDPEMIIKSIEEKLLPLDSNLSVYPGHGPQSTLGYEKEHNPFLK